MSEQGVKALLDRFDTDPDFRQRLQRASTPAERQEILGDVGSDVDQGELETIWGRVATEVEIPDEELDKIAGGVTEATGATGIDTFGSFGSFGS